MKICFVTGTRAEYGLLKPLMDEISSVKDWTLQLLVTGSHLSDVFGSTYKQIEADGFFIDKKVDMQLCSDTPKGIVQSMGIGMAGYADAFSELQPDLLIVLGDRYEILAVVSAALIFKIPIAHLHGGEITEGAFDDSIRHAITKMAHLHFTSTEAYRQRVIQLGEHPDTVFNVGAIGIDNIKTLLFLSKKELEKTLEITFRKYNYLITFHPATLDDQSAEEQFKQLLMAIDDQDDSFFVFTKANADTDARIINQLMDDYVSRNASKAAAFTSLGQLRYLSLMKIVDAVVGNSSSGIIEAPSFKIPTINIGSRQKGRIQALSVLNCESQRDEINKCFDQIKQADFKEKLANVENPYGEGGTAQKIKNIIKSTALQNLIPKSFFDR